MITVAILINGAPILARTATNSGGIGANAGENLYHLDTGGALSHNPGHGAVPLAIKMLGTISSKVDTGIKVDR